MKSAFLILLFATSAIAEPTVTSIEPSSAPASGGVFVHVYGSDLVGFALACPTIECSDYVRFGDVLGGIAISSPGEIVVLAPPHAAGSVDLTINIAGKKKIIMPDAFIYEPLDTSTYERVLLPVVLSGTAPTPGAFGSMWKAEATFHNASSVAVPINAPNCPPFVLTPCAPPILQANSTVVMPLYGSPGAFVGIPRAHISEVDIALRIQDLSRQSQDFGTSLPIVRVTQFKPAIRLVGLPADSNFRLTLRIYGYGDAKPVRVNDTEVNLSGSDPAYAQVDVPAGTTLIEVSSAVDPPQPLWAFVSVTNNATQHVTAIAPTPQQ